MAIPNEYKETLDDIIDNLNTEPLNWPRLIDKELCNTSRFESSLTELLKDDRLNKDVSDRLSWLVLKIGKS